MARYVFPYRREFSALIGEIHRPIATIYIKAKTGEWKPYQPYVDAGADVTFFPRRICTDDLRYTFEDGKLGYVGGITPERVKVYIHSLPIRIGHKEFKARIAFAERDNIPALLGRTDIFNRFKVCYDYKRLETTFTTT